MSSFVPNTPRRFFRYDPVWRSAARSGRGGECTPAAAASAAATRTATCSQCPATSVHAACRASVRRGVLLYERMGECVGRTLGTAATKWHGLCKAKSRATNTKDTACVRGVVRGKSLPKGCTREEGEESQPKGWSREVTEVD